MKAVCNREGLLSAFQVANVAVPSRDVKPILKNLKAIAEEDRCVLMATDLELGIRLDVRSVNVNEPGEGILPAARLLAILRESQDEELTIEVDSNACIVRGEHMEFEMPSEDPANFPDFIHSGAGHRAGMALMIKRVLVDGWTVEKAGIEAAASGLIDDNPMAPVWWKFAQDYIMSHKK